MQRELRQFWQTHRGTFRSTGKLRLRPLLVIASFFICYLLCLRWNQFSSEEDLSLRMACCVFSKTTQTQKRPRKRKEGPLRFDFRQVWNFGWLLCASPPKPGRGNLNVRNDAVSKFFLFFIFLKKHVFICFQRQTKGQKCTSAGPVYFFSSMIFLGESLYRFFFV